MPSMATAIRRLEKIRLVSQLKQVFLNPCIPRSVFSKSDSDTESESAFGSSHRTPPGYIAVDVGPNRELFVIPIRLLNLPIFAALLQRSAEQFGYPVDGPLILPCDAQFLDRVLKLLTKDEERFGKLKLDEFLNMFGNVGIDTCTDGETKRKKSRKPTFFS